MGLTTSLEISVKDTLRNRAKAPHLQESPRTLSSPLGSAGILKSPQPFSTNLKLSPGSIPRLAWHQAHPASSPQRVGRRGQAGDVRVPFLAVPSGSWDSLRPLLPPGPKERSGVWLPEGPQPSEACAPSLGWSGHGWVSAKVMEQGSAQGIPGGRPCSRQTGMVSADRRPSSRL